MNISKTAATVIFAGALAGGIAPAAMALNTQYPSDGGVWEYGLEPLTAVSYYSHDRLCHGSSVVNDWGSNRSIDTAPGAKSIAKQRATGLTHNHYYYRVC